MPSIQTDFLQIKQDYDLIKAIDIAANLSKLDAALYQYSVTANKSNMNAVKTAFQPIADYYTQLRSITDKLKAFLKSASEIVVDSDLGNEERYLERVHPEGTIKAREIYGGIIPTMHMESLPYILAAGSFMAIVALFMIFQTVGIETSISIPPALTARLYGPATVGLIPFYKNPLILSGSVIVLLIAVVVYSVLYYRK